MPKMQPIFTVPGIRRVRNRRYYTNEIWSKALLEKEEVGSRRDWKWALTLLYEYSGQIVLEDGRVFHVPLIDDVFPDPDMRWMDLFFEPAPCGTRPARISRKTQRLQFLNVYCQIRDFERTAVPEPPPYLA